MLATCFISYTNSLIISINLLLHRTCRFLSGSGRKTSPVFITPITEGWRAWVKYWDLNELSTEILSTEMGDHYLRMVTHFGANPSRGRVTLVTCTTVLALNYIVATATSPVHYSLFIHWAKLYLFCSIWKRVTSRCHSLSELYGAGRCISASSLHLCTMMLVFIHRRVTT